MGKSFETALELVNLVEKKNIKLLFNPSLYLAKKGKTYLRPVLVATTILVLNKEEAQALLKTKENNIKKLAKALHQLGPKAVVITDSIRRMYAFYNEKFYSLLPPDVKTVHTAGAGDAFTAGLLAGAIKKYPFEAALCLGQANSSSVIQSIGTKNGLLKEREAKDLARKLKMTVKC